MAYAHQLFDKFPDPNVMLWNAMLTGYAQNESHTRVISLFGEMTRSNVQPNCFTFPIVLKSCGKVMALREGEQIHCVLLKSGFRSNPYAGTTLIDLYSGSGVIGSAYKVFGEMLERNVVVWTSMVNGYILCHDVDSAKQLFDLAPERDIILWNTMVSGYIEFGDTLAARKLFDMMPNRDTMSWNTLLNGYANNGDFELCKELFEEMPNRNVFSWNGMIGCYARSGNYLEVLSAFKRMLREAEVLPNDSTLVIVLSACARLGALDLGKWVHVYSENNGYKDNVYVGNGLIDMYAKCGTVENVMTVFQSMASKDLISWNTIIGGLAVNGRGADALSLFSQMKTAGVKPDGVTFIAVLCACTHMGLVKDGYAYFQAMVDDFAIIPQIEHYGCMVDLLGRAGLVNEAVDFVRRMPMKADGVIWTALLSACKIYKNIDVAELALKELIELEPQNPSNYVMLSNIYGDIGRWSDVARLKVAMRDTGYKKLPGCSSIEVDAGVAEFYSLDERHAESDKIYEALRGLTKLLRSYGYVPKLTQDHSKL